MNELIRVTQLPVIEERLRSMKDQVDKTVGDAMSLVCTEETVQTVKSIRAGLNNQFMELEEQRTAVKAAVLGPYEQFERVYRECVSDRFRQADGELKGKIDAVVQQSKVVRREQRDYFAELCAARHIDFMKSSRPHTWTCLRKGQDAQEAEGAALHLCGWCGHSTELILPCRARGDHGGVQADAGRRRRRLHRTGAPTGARGGEGGPGRQGGRQSGETGGRQGGRRRFSGSGCACGGARNGPPLRVHGVCHQDAASQVEGVFESGGDSV